MLDSSMRAKRELELKIENNYQVRWYERKADRIASALKFNHKDLLQELVMENQAGPGEITASEWANIELKESIARHGKAYGAVYGFKDEEPTRD